MYPFFLTAYASVDDTIRQINAQIVNPLIMLMFAIAAVYFAYGVFEYLKDSDSADAREKGKQHIIWGLIGMFIMVGVFFITDVILGTIGIDPNQINVREIQVDLPPITVTSD